MIGLIRGAVRLLLLAAWTIAMYGIRLLTMATLLFSKRLDRRIRRALFKTYSRGVARIAGIRITVKGVPPKPPFFLVCNHLTYVDGVVLASRLGCSFVAKSEVAGWPVLGFLAKQLNVIFINRQNRVDTVRVNDCIGQAMALGDGIAMFAESTTSRGQDVRPFKSALLEVAVQNQCPVHYAALHYATPPGAPPPSQWVCWWAPGPDGTPQSFAANVQGVLRGPGLHATVTFGDQPISSADRKVLAQELHAAVKRIFVPME